MNYWQVAAGSQSRDYSDDFLRFGMAFVGGEHNESVMKNLVQPGDIMVLKIGMSNIKAAGKVVERDSDHNRDAYRDPKMKWLLDYDGWELPAYCYVNWYSPESAVNVTGLTRTTIEGINLQEIKAEADRIISSSRRVKPKELPRAVEELSENEMLRHLIKFGLSPSSADRMSNTIKKIRLLSDYYYQQSWEDIREHETRTFLIIPFLLALGWSEQQLKIELAVPKGRVDIACFSRPYHRALNGNANIEDCCILVESKGLSQGLDYAFSQASTYSKHFPKCDAIISSNGYCYKAFIRDRVSNEFSSWPAAYLNLRNPAKKYPRDPENVDGALKLLEYLLPMRPR